MMSQMPIVRPPRLAAWLVDSFAPPEHAESIPGDLVEEFSSRASKSGIDSARAWYWRQSVRTVAHLIAANFRVAPWLIASQIVGGLLLWQVAVGLPEPAIMTVLDFRRHGVIPYYSWSQMQTYLFWFNTGILLGRLFASLLVGFIVATVARGRELVTTLALGLLPPVFIIVIDSIRLVRRWPEYDLHLILISLTLSYTIMIVAGGWIVREIRVAKAHRPSHSPTA
jgi:hypothetical protein